MDKNGDLRAWWSDESVRGFKKAAKCLVDQYSGFVMPEINKNVSEIL